mmetsp:Transcript_29948/g.48252  ORF Transcript_29948/g.48252 Transcript_29948/m.48252 type:complete len:444 (-) Transcript_29948:258-1589(-)
MSHTPQAPTTQPPASLLLRCGSDPYSIGDASDSGSEADTENETCSETQLAAQHAFFGTSFAGMGVLRRNNSMPSIGSAEDINGVLPRNRSADMWGQEEYDSEASEMDSMFIEVDGKAVLAPQSERLSLKSNPYVGNFHYGHQASKKLGGRDEDVAACSPLGSPTPRSRPGAKKVATMSRSNSGQGSCMSSSTSGQSLPRSSSITLEDREKMKQALQLQSSVPADPEMCGLQALLPRQGGMQVQYTVGEGSFGKCVKVLNRKNRQEWSKTTSKRGIERHLNALPLEGESLVIKYIKKDDPAESATTLYSGLDADLVQSAVQREIRIHGLCNHPNIVRLFGHYELGCKVGLILGFVEGAELHDVLHMKRKLPEPECFLIMLQMMRATQVQMPSNTPPQPSSGAAQTQSRAQRRGQRSCRSPKLGCTAEGLRQRGASRRSCRALSL